MAQKDDGGFENSTKFSIYDNDYAECDVKVRDHCHVTEKYRNSAHGDCNINVKLNHKICIVFHNLKNYDSYLIMQKISKFNFKINAIPNVLEKYMSFNQIVYLNIWVKMILSIWDQEFVSNVLSLFKNRILSWWGCERFRKV